MKTEREYGLFIRGEVKITDLNKNKIVFQKHNMIVQNGRDYVRNLFLKQSPNLFAVTETLPTLEKVKFGGYSRNSASDENITTTQQTSVDDISLAHPLANYTYMLKGKASEASEKKNTADVSFDESGNRIKISIKQTGAIGNEAVLINELGIFLSNNKMFSRISFDGVYLDSTSSFQIDYYIYF